MGEKEIYLYLLNRANSPFWCNYYWFVEGYTGDERGGAILPSPS